MRAGNWVATCLVVAAMAPAAAAQADTIEFALPEQPLSQALISFAVQARVSISIPRDDLPPGAKSVAVHGRMTRSAALKALLAGSDFDLEEVNATTFKLVRNMQGGLVRPDAVIPRQVRSPDLPPDSRELDTSDLLDC